MIVLLMLLFSLSTAYASEHNNLIGKPIEFNVFEKDSDSIVFENVTALLINNDIEFRIYFKNGTLSRYSFFNPPEGNKIMIAGKADEDVNKDGILTIRTSLEEFKKFGFITIIVFDDYSVRQALGIKPKEINYSTLPKSFSFDDKNLNNVIKESLQKDTFTEKDLNSITHLNASNKNISNINGLDKLTNLTYLNLGNNQISNINILKSLTKLEYLNISQNDITDITILNTLKKLESLFLVKNPIEDYRPLEEVFHTLTNKDFSDEMIKILIEDGELKDLNLIKSYENLVVDYTTSKFSDVPKGEWYTKNISYLVAMRISKGYTDGTFRPEDNINVDEFITMVVTAFGYDIKPAEEYWATPFIEKAIALGLVGEGDFTNYKRQITRGEIAKIISNCLNIDPKDIPIDDWDRYEKMILDYNDIPDKYKEDIIIAYSQGIIGGYPDNTYKHDKLASRGGAASIIIRLIDLTARIKP